LKESGKVIRIIGDGLVEVEIKASSGCAKCGACNFDRSGTMSMEAKNEIGASRGDVVEIEIPEGSVIFSSLLIFIFPIIAFFAGYIMKGLILGSICLLAYMIFLFVYDRKKRVIPRITALIK